MQCLTTTNILNRMGRIRSSLYAHRCGYKNMLDLQLIGIYPLCVFGNTISNFKLQIEHRTSIRCLILSPVWCSRFGLRTVLVWNCMRIRRLGTTFDTIRKIHRQYRNQECYGVLVRQFDRRWWNSKHDLSEAVLYGCSYIGYTIVCSFILYIAESHLFLIDVIWSILQKMGVCFWTF